MKFLKKLGVAIAKGSVVLGKVTGYWPMIEGAVQTFAPKAADEMATIGDTLTKIGGVVVQVEAVGAALQLPGAQKLTAASPLVAQLILQSDLARGRKIDDQEEFARGVAKITEGVVDVLNSFKDEVE